MGRYIAHKRRKIKRTKGDARTDGAAASAVRGRETALQREAERLELERARAVKQARAEERRMRRQEVVVDRTAGRKRTAARAAGFALISATAGMRTLCISIDRVPGTNPDDLWRADFKMESELDQDHRIQASAILADENAIHLMRALAPRIAEELVLGSATPGADKNNSETASILAETYMQKIRSIIALNEDEENKVKAGIVAEFERTVLLRLIYHHLELNTIIEDLMKATFVNRRKCDAALQGIYAGFRDFSNGQMKSHTFQLTRKAEERAGDRTRQSPLSNLRLHSVGRPS
ncbi:MAG: hypothetical protein ACLPSW_28135 [Roseiarcus sp.]|jgi:hypothetical protein